MNESYSVCEKALLSGEPWPRNLAAQTAIQPLIWRSESLYSKAYSSPEECLFTDAGMNHKERLSETSFEDWSSARGAHGTGRRQQIK